MDQCKKHLPDGQSPVVAITGATGFIGSAICRHLLAVGFRVRGLARAPARGRKLEMQGAEIIQGDLFDRTALMSLLSHADAVVHCAGTVRGASQEQFDQVNVEGLRQLLQTLSECDTALPIPILSLSSLAAREPELSFYAASKYRGEEVLSKEAHAHGLSWMILRPPPVYGPGDKELLPLFRLMARGLTPIPGTPDARFSMLFVDDLAAAVEAWLRAENAASGIYTLEDGHSGGYTWADIADIIARLCQRRVRLFCVPRWMLDVPARINRTTAKLFGYAPMLTPEKLRELRHADWVCDSKALCSTIEWQPKVGLAEGLRKTPGWSGYQSRIH